MSAVTVRNHHEIKDEALSLLDKIEQIHAVIRRKAHELSELGRARLSSDLDNWLAAERQVVYVPACELLEDGKRYRLRAALPGLKPEQIEVTALPHLLILEGEARDAGRERIGGLVFSEFSQEKVLRRFDLPDKIDVDKVRARVQDGVLEVTATKAATKVTKRKSPSGSARSRARGRAGAGKAKTSAKGRRKPKE